VCVQQCSDPVRYRTYVTYEQCSFYILACHLQIVADPDPDPDYHFDEDPNPAYHVDADPDPDPTFQFDVDSDPDPQYCLKLLPVSNF
jgi:hypothetical protein